MIRANRSKGFWSGVAVTLATLALFLQVLVPAGTMVAREGDQTFLTLCTGHGPLMIAAADDASGGKKAPPAGKTSDAPCAFAGHAPPVPLPTVAPLERPARAPAPLAALTPASRPAPDRGLAAPPPPSQAPPTLLI
jgi:hypothetical protein